MADASVTAIDGRAVVRVGGSELLDIYIGQAIVASGQATASAEAAAADAEDAAQSAALAEIAALTAPNVFADEAAGRAAVANGQTFWTDLGDAGLGLYRRTSSTVSALVSKIITGAMLASASGSALIGHSVAAIGSVVRPVQAVLRDAAFNPKDFGAVGDSAYHPISERYSTLAAALAAYPFINDAPIAAPLLDANGNPRFPWTKDGSGNPVLLWSNRSLDRAGIQAAANAAALNANIRGAVRIPLGYYVLDDSVQAPSFVTIRGESRHGCVLFNQVLPLNAPMIVNKDPVAWLASELHDFTMYGGTYAIDINVSAEQAGAVYSGLGTALQSNGVFRANKLQTTKFRDCNFGPPAAGRTIDVYGGLCNAIIFDNVRAASGPDGLLRLLGFDGVHWTGGSMEGGGRSLKATGTISGDVLNVTELNDGIGPISVGDSVLGKGVRPGTVVESWGTGTGGTGGYVLNQSIDATFGPGPLIIGPATINLETGGVRATTATFSYIYFEGTHRLLMRSAGSAGVAIDMCKSTFATFGEPFRFDTGADMIAIGTNHFDTDVEGPLNTLLYGSTPRLGGDINVWTSNGQKTGRVVTRPRDLATTPKFDLLVFNRATATPGSDNRHLITGTLTVSAEGYDANGAVRSICRTYRVKARSVSNNPLSCVIIQTDAQDDLSEAPNPIETLTVKVKGSPGVTELRVEVEALNFNTSLPCSVFAVFEYGGNATLPADMMRVSAA